MASKRKECSIENYFKKKNRQQVQKSVVAVATNTCGLWPIAIFFSVGLFRCVCYFFVLCVSCSCIPMCFLFVHTYVLRVRDKIIRFLWLLVEGSHIIFTGPLFRIFNFRMVITSNWLLQFKSDQEFKCKSHLYRSTTRPP